MCIYTVKKQNLYKNIKKYSRGVRDSTERHKIVVSGVRDILKIIFTWLQERYQRKNTLYSTCVQHEMPQSLLVFAYP